MIKYEIHKPIPACHVNKDFLIELEGYIRSEIPKLIGTSKKLLSEEYSITIIDEKGTGEIDTIFNYASNLFPDSIKDINIKVHLFMSTGKYFMLTISFNREAFGRYSNYIEISYESKKAREVVSGIYEGIKRIIESYRNHNEFYSRYSVIDSSIPAVFFFYVSLLLLLEKIIVFFAIFLTIGLLLMLYYIIGKKFKPFISFETNRYFRVQKSFSTFKTILIAIFGTFIFTIIVAFWGKLIAWFK